MKNSQIITAETFGMIDFEQGKMRVPAQSKSLMEMLTGRKIGQTPKGEAKSTDLMKAWTRGWDKAKNIERQSR